MKAAPMLMRRGLRGPKANKAPLPMRQGFGCSQREGGPRNVSAGALVRYKGSRPLRKPCGGLNGPKEQETPTPLWRAPLVPNRTRRPHQCGGGLGILEPDASAPIWQGLRRPIVPPIVLAKKGVMGGVLHMVK